MKSKNPELQALFEYFYDEHKLTLVESEMADIIRKVNVIMWDKCRELQNELSASAFLLQNEKQAGIELSDMALSMKEKADKWMERTEEAMDMFEDSRTIFYLREKWHKEDSDEQ